MSKVSEHLTDYVIQKGMINEEDRSVYEYGFTIAIELGIFISFCLIISISLHMVVEGILFFVIFSPLRSYAGGLHMEKFWSCFILSCLTFSVILAITNYIQIPMALSFLVLLILELAVYRMYPVENRNRDVDEDENKYFKRKLVTFLGVDTLLGVIFMITKRSGYLQEIVLIFFMVVITMLIGKYGKKNICQKTE